LTNPYGLDNIPPMGIYRICAYIAFLILGVASSVQARPVSYADGWMIMQTNNFMMNSLSASYSPTARYAFGVETDYFRDENTWLHAFTYNRLLKRWNLPDAQANIFLLSGFGVADDHRDLAPAAFGGLEADWENRRLYAAYENRVTGSSNIDQNFFQRVRVGFAPYEGDYEGLNTWLMLQVDNVPGSEDSIVVTPFVRLFTSEYLTEIGISDNKDIMFNLTLQF